MGKLSKHLIAEQSIAKSYFSEMVLGSLLASLPHILSSHYLTLDFPTMSDCYVKGSRNKSYEVTCEQKINATEMKRNITFMDYL